ncbi:MAG: zinc metallopeptidase, partial [Nitrospira sp.]|nr:zinc metallopeptidase [Nitrospira sp.]
VRLTPTIFDGKSLTAITVAAHEVGHAIQDHLGLPAPRGAHQARAGRAGSAEGRCGPDDGNSDRGGRCPNPHGRHFRHGSGGWRPWGISHAGPLRHASSRVGRQLQTCPSRSPTGKLSVARR